MFQVLGLSNVELAATFVAVTTAALFFKSLLTRDQHLPPGPRPLPVIGNLLDLPKREPWLTYDDCSRKYNSDVLYLSVLGTDIIIINSGTAAGALLERKARIYSDRPRMTMINELIGLKWHFGFMRHGDAWSKTRKIFNNELNPVGSARLRPQIRKWNDIFLKNVANEPERLFDHIQHMASGIALETAFGMQVQPSGQPDPFIGAAKAAVDAMIQGGLYGSYLVDFLPSLRHVPTPFANFKKQASRWRTSVDIAGTVPISLVKKAMAENKGELCIAAKLLENASPEDEEAIAQAAHAMFASGSAATVSALSTFVLAMILYPQVQAKAQSEVDRHVGEKNQLPDCGDEKSLPYVSAIVKEVLRWNPVVPLAFPHRLTADDTYNGYHLPAGSVVVPNAWAILHDSDVYGPDTSSFKPERFLQDDGTLNPSVKGPNAAFGFAFRRCPGQYLTQDSLFITIATTLASFNISKAVGENGEEVEPILEYTSGMLRYPHAFKYRITPREKSVKAL